MGIPSEILDRLPPFDREAEVGVLGSILLDGGKLDEVSVIIVERDFYVDAHRRLYRHMIAMRDERLPIDVLTLVDRMRRAGELEAVGSAAYLAEVLSNVPVASHAVHYARIVAEHSRRRAVIHAAQEMLRTAWDLRVDAEAAVAACEKELQAIPTGEYKGEPVTFHRAVMDACAAVDAIASRKREAGMMVGLESFDSAVGGLFAGELIILAARPSIGKTALALQIAEHFSRRGRGVYVASLEMAATQLALRVLCGHCGVPMARVRSGSLNEDDMAALVGACGELHARPIVLHDRAGLTVQDIRRACRQKKAKGDLSLVVVDYLQRVTPADRKCDRHLQVGQITWDLKAMALELQAPVLCLCQLSRAAEERDRKTGKTLEPKLSHLKESGDVEQDADMVLLLHREQRASESLMILAKNRHGEQARFHLVWDGARTRFSCGGLPGRETAFDKFSGEEEF